MKVLMVCLGNICRSPLAQGILLEKTTMQNLNWEVDSCGTSGYHDGEAPDRRSIKIARENGIDISRQMSRRLETADLDYFDLILAMDTDNYNAIKKLCLTDQQRSKVALILNYLYPAENRVVPDPYYNDGFSLVYDLLDQACDKIVDWHS